MRANSSTESGIISDVISVLESEFRRDLSTAWRPQGNARDRSKEYCKIFQA